MSKITTLSIAVSDLPEGYFKEQLTKMVIDPTTTKVNIVASNNEYDWAAYIGFPTSMEEIRPEKRNHSMIYYVANVSDPLSVASRGAKLSKELACKLFPLFTDQRYRR